MRGVLIKLGARAKRQRRQHIQDIISKIHTLETQNKANASPLASEQLTQLRYELRLILLHNFEKTSKHLKMTYYVSGNKAGRLLANCLKGQRHKTKIPYVLHPKTQEKLHHPQAIADAFSYYYSSLYNLQEDSAMIQPTKFMISDFLERLNSPMNQMPS